jgi:restriction endonuclease S subunit
MIVRLKEIAEIQMGYSFRSKLLGQQDSNVAVIQMKDLTEANTVETSSLIKIYLDKFDDRHIVKKSDLVFRSRGQNNTMAIMNKELQNAVLAAPLLKIRINKKVILPEYLLWFINNPESRRWFSKRREGSHGGMINKKALEEFEVLIPSLDKQKEILEISNSMMKEEQIMKRLLVLHKQYNSHLLLKIAKGE